VSASNERVAECSRVNAPAPAAEHGEGGAENGGHGNDGPSKLQGISALQVNYRYEFKFAFYFILLNTKLQNKKVAQKL